MRKAVALTLVLACIIGCACSVSAMTVLSSQNLSVDGKTIDCEKYNIDGSNYFKLRDIAHLLNGTRAQFAVGWDSASQTVSILTKEKYTPNGSELDLSGGDKSATAKPSKQTLQIDGKTVTGLSVYNIGGNNYFKLRDLGDALGFGVGYDEATRTATIDSSVANSTTTSPKTEFSAEDLFKKCSPAVFYIETYDAGGYIKSTGSGFFIDDVGTAVTNYHVIEGACDAAITTPDTKKDYEVAGVYSYDKEQDWAVIKIDGSGFSYLNMDTSGSISSGSTVFAIGSPLGLQNTITEGIISNPSRKENSVTYIQTSAAISPGSSGGALIDTSGNAIGITSASYVKGQNLNLALPVSYINHSKKDEVISLLTLLTGNPNSAIMGYPDFPDVLDCGAFYGAPIFSVEKADDMTIYYYDLSTITSNTWKSGYGSKDYTTALEEWDFEYVKDFYVDDIVGWQYKTEYVDLNYDLLVGYETFKNIKCMFVGIRTEKHDTSKAYAKYPNVPDFGAYFGVQEFDASDLSVGNISATHYGYKTSDISKTRYANSYLYLCRELLRLWGYKLSSVDRERGIYSYTKDTTKISISANNNEFQLLNINVFVTQ